MATNIKNEVKKSGYDTGSVIVAVSTLLLVAASAFGIVGTIRNQNGLEQQRNQIIAENPGCIFIEESRIAKQYYMVCDGELSVRSLKPIVLPIQSPVEETNTSEVQ